MPLINRKLKAILLLLYVSAMNLYITAYPSLARGASSENVPEALRIDPSLLKTIQGSDPDSVIPVIITFDANTCNTDQIEFLRGMAGSSFVLKYRYSIIPAISGSIQSHDLGALEALSATISFRVCENANSSIQLAIRSSDGGIAVNSGINPSQATKWWHTMIGRNQSLVQSLNLSAIKVGVIDTGIGFNQSGSYAVHADLAGCLTASVNLASGTAVGDVFDEYGHGTHVAGIIAGSGAASSQNFAGVAPGVKIYNIKVLNGSGSGLEDDIIKGLEYAVNESLDIVNLSLGGGNPDPLDPESMAVKNATEQGVLVVIANGNDGPGYFTVSSPAAAVGAISVGAMNQYKNISDFSSWGPSMGRIFKPDVVAPGEGIVSALGYNSYIQKYFGYFKLTMSGTTNANNDYVPLDGTSMATPMVAGAAAVILAKYHQYGLSPAVVAASLLETAVDLGYDTCTQGMGLINITRAIAFLESVRVQNNLTSLARIYPKRVPYAPYDIIDFPDQRSEMMVKILHHGTQAIHFDTTPIPAGMQLVISPNATTINSLVGLTLFNVSISTDFDAVPGNYSVDLLLKNASDTVLDNITIRFTLHSPKLKVYLDSYHPLEDVFPHVFPLSRFAMDYYPYIKYLANQRIQVDTGMEYWTTGYNASQQRTPFVDSWLSKYDMVIIPPLKSALFDDELAALSRFHQSGGHVVLLGSRHQEFSIGGGNAMLEALGMNASFTSTNLEIIRDNGWEHDVIDFILTDVNSSNVLGTNVTRLAWTSGCTLDNGDPRAPDVAFSTHGDVVVSMLPAIGGNGSILVAGSESILPASVDAVSSANNTRFFDNLFTYAMNLADGIRIDTVAAPGIVYNETSLQAFFHVSNTTSGAYYIPSTNITAALCTVSNASGVLLQVGLNDGANEWFGNSSLNITTLAFSAEPYRLTLNVTIGAQQHIRYITFFKFNRSTTVPALDTIIFSGFRGSNLSVVFDSILQNETVILGGNPGNPLSTTDEITTDDIFSKKAVVTSTYSIVSSNHITIPIGTSLPPGLYLLNFMHATRTDLYPYETSQRASIYVRNHEPSINKQGSSFEGTSLDNLDLGNGMIQVVTAQVNADLQIVVAGADSESSQSALAAFVIFYPICVIDGTAHLIPYGSQPFMSKLSYNAAANNFLGSISIPAAVTFTVGSNQVTRQFTSWGDFSGALILVLRDDDGAYDLAFIFMNLTSGLSIDWVWYLVVGVAGGLALAFVILTLRKRRSSVPRASEVEYDDYKPEVIDNRQKLRFCPYCAAEVKVKTKYCPYCGQRINFT